MATFSGTILFKKSFVQIIAPFILLPSGEILPHKKT
jgi:hypothetical protein